MTKGNKKRFWRVVFVCMLVLIISVWTVENYKRLENEKKLNAEKISLSNEVSILEREIKILEEEISNKDSLEFIEKIARDEFGMVKPDEVIVIDLNKKHNPFKEISNEN